jgi:hypothetical protein
VNRLRDQWQTLRQAFQSYGRIMRLLWQTHRRYTVLILGLTLISALAVPAQIWLVKVIIDRVSLLLTATGAPAAVVWAPVVTPAILSMCVDCF